MVALSPVKVVHIALHTLRIVEKAAHPVRVDIVPAIIIMRMRKDVPIHRVLDTIITVREVDTVPATTMDTVPHSRVEDTAATTVAKVAIVARVTAKADSVLVTTTIARTDASITTVRSVSAPPITIQMLSIV
jgi:hypothetical protein